MNVWVETISKFPEREGKYLICPIHSETVRDFPKYRILKDIMIHDVVFHYLVGVGFTSYSQVKSSYQIINHKDPYCIGSPPYRRVELHKNTRLPRPITMEMLIPYRERLLQISDEAGFSRTPFDKNFRMKQLYLSRIPLPFIKIFEEILKRQIGLNKLINQY